MKNATKILLVLLALAMTLSCACVFASADGTVTEENVDDILEYFEMPVYYNLDGKYNSDEAAATDIRAKVGADSTILTEVTVTNDVEAADDGYYVSLLTKNAKSVEFSGEITERAIYTLETRFAVSKNTAAKYGYVSLLYNYMDGEAEKTVKITGKDITEAKTNTYGAWINATIVMTPVKVETQDGMVDGYSIVYSLKSDDGTVISTNVEDPDVIRSNVTGFSMKVATIGSSNATSKPYQFVKIDYLKVYGGSFPRALANYSGEVDALLVGMMDLYDQTQDDMLKLRILENINKVTSPAVYNYAPVSQDAKDAAAEAANAIIGFYTGKLVSSAAEINANASYPERAAKAAEISVYDAAIPETYAGDDADAVLAAKAAYKQEADALAALKEQSDGFLSAIAPLTSLTFPYTEDTVTYIDIAKYLASKNYVELKALYDAIAPYNPCATYPGVAETDAVKDALVSDFTARKTRLDAFLAAMEIVADDTKSIGVRYSAYLDAGNAKFEDESAEGITAALALYDEFGTYCEDIVKNANDFILAVGNANISTYYSQKMDYLKAANELVANVELSMPGVAEAMAQYDALYGTLEAQKRDVDAFLAAVAAISDEMTFMQKKEAVDAALALQAKGAVTGFEGVSEANIKLSAYESEIKTPEGYSRCFIEYVGLAKNASDLLTCRAAIMKAKAIIESAEDAYDGVTAAKADLAAAIASYNASVNSFNSAFAATANQAVETVSAAAPAECVKQAVAILKKIFD